MMVFKHMGETFTPQFIPRVTDERGNNNIADRSLDRVSASQIAAAAKGNANNLVSGNNILQTRAELLQNEYKKVIENHPGTIAAGHGSSGKYDDTDLLSRMFSKDAGGGMLLLPSSTNADQQ